MLFELQKSARSGCELPRICGHIMHSENSDYNGHTVVNFYLPSGVIVKAN